jgi:hypothetical protein
VLATKLTAWGGKPGYFWLALGLSLAGAAIMIVAQRIRLRLFDERQGELLFGPDVLRNLALTIMAPLLFRLGGVDYLAALYLATALVTLLFYWGARHAGEPRRDAASPILIVAIAAGILLPLFALLSGRVFHSRWDSSLDLGASMLTVPLPLSLAACFTGIIIVARYRDAALALTTIFFLFVAMVLTTIVTTRGEIGGEWRKIVLLFQFLIPAFALVLGQMIGARGDGVRLVALGFCAVLALLVPVQLLRSIGNEVGQLSENVWLFSVYQHLQYVPAVVVSAYFIALLALWGGTRARWVVFALAPLVAYYAVSSYSTLAIALVAGGAVVFALATFRDAAARICAVLILATCMGALYVKRDSALLRAKFERSRAATDVRLSQGPEAGVSREVIEGVPGPLQVRLHYWSFYARGIAESGRSALLGHPQAIDRAVAPSAHNYYLDFVYNFGVLGFLPLAGLIAYTLALLWRERASVWRDPALLGLAIGVVFVLAIDNMFKVPLRQPYPGIFFFFLWGLLIARLKSIRA